MKRKDFLKTACPAVVFGLFGVSLIQACSSDDSPLLGDGSGTIGGSGGYGGGGGYGGDSDSGQGSGSSTNTSGVSVEGSNVIIDLTNQNFASLENVGGWMNLQSHDLLLIRVSADTVRAFDNCCPHQGTKDRWSYASGSFTCANHGNSFSIDGSSVVECSSGASSGTLKSFDAQINDGVLTVSR